MVRLRHRYIIADIEMDCEWKNQNTSRANAILEALTKSIKNLHGVHGVALCKAGLMAKYVNGTTKICFIRMRRSAHSLVASAIPFVNRLDGQVMSFKTLYTGATIRHCNIFLQRYHRRELETKYGSLKSDLQRKLFEKEIASVPKMFISVA